KHEPTDNKMAIKWQSVTKSTLHCGSGCTLGDVCSAIFVSFSPLYILHSSILGEWLFDFALAFLIGIVFQYFAIRSMKSIGFSKAIVAALKADTLSLIAWQIGMYGWMSVVIWVIFKHPLPKSDPVFWFMMQI